MLRSSLVLLVLALSASANSQGFDYNYLQLDYGNLDFDDINADGDGVGLSGSFAINPDWHVFAGYQSAGLDRGIDVNAFNAGIGYNTEMSPTVDAYARFSYEYIDFDAPGGNGGDDSGLGFGIGMLSILVATTATTLLSHLARFTVSPMLSHWVSRVAGAAT